MTSYISEDDVLRISTGRSCRFYARASDRLITDCVVEAVDNSSAETIEDPAFASVFGGDIAVRQTGEKLVPERAVYRVRMRVLDPTLTVPAQRSGHVVIEAEQRALFDRLWKWGLSVVIRETGF